MKRLIRIYVFLLAAILVAPSCLQKEQDPGTNKLPDGTPVTLCIGFGASGPFEVEMSTKSTANRADETRVHDLYVMIFKADGSRFYRRYFSYEHLNTTSIEDLISNPNEGWWVDNISLSDLTNNPSKQTRGVVKISTEAQTGCTLVLLANVKNNVTNLDGEEDPVAYLTNEVTTLSKFQSIKVGLEQAVVNRTDLFLMVGKLPGVDTGLMTWGEMNGQTPDYNNTYKVSLNPLDAKVKFRVRGNPTYIDNVTARNWQVFRVPSKSWLDEGQSGDPNDPEDYFDITDAYFEGEESDGGYSWKVFSFYMLENQLTPKHTVSEKSTLGVGADVTSDYYLREFQDKSTDDPGHAGYIKNGPWVFANDYSTYVKFDAVLKLNDNGISAIEDGIAQALTSDAQFTVHLGNFTTTPPNPDDYNTLRGYSYTYDIVINNSTSINIEVRGDKDDSYRQKETQPGQEGSLLLTTDSIINCDAHYEYHSMTFSYNDALAVNDGVWTSRAKFSWYIKTPFDEGGATLNTTTGYYEIPNNRTDYEWVLFTLNEKNNSGNYVQTRRAYPGDSHYNSSWDPTTQDYTDEQLMNVNQLVNLLFRETSKKYAGGNNDNLFDNNGKICVTAYVNEFYYESDPTADTPAVDPNLWRQFVNAKPRELHILSATQYSKDRQSDVITSSHSIIQQSIQTIYNIHAPDLNSLWGTEHNDNLHKGAENAGWPWWPEGIGLPPGSILYSDDENGRLNTAGLWGLTSGATLEWDQFLNYAVDNNTPELKDNYQYLAYACLSRNRDNNGNRKIDQDELRWYTASINQLVGMWVGNEALSQTARVYQPVNSLSSTDVLWRSAVVSSTFNNNAQHLLTDPDILRAEEGATKSHYQEHWWTQNLQDWYSTTSVRCLRNIGTWRDGSETKDISSAPYDLMTDQYYVFEQGEDPNGKAWPNDDGTYTIKFSRLNPRSIREYTAEDLPYHEEYSLHNCVYLTLTAQNKTNVVYADGEVPDITLDNLNFAVSEHDDYCPPGYRLPNMTELLMIVSLLPADYFSEGNAMYYPSRTYFSRGKLGSNQTTSEKNKVGWSFNDRSTGVKRVNLGGGSEKMTAIRCVKDKESIGDLSGKITVENSNQLHQNEMMNIELNFNSSASPITQVDLSLVYLDNYGQEHEVSIPYTIPNSSITLQDNLSWRIPNDLPVLGYMTVRAHVFNAVFDRYFETPVRIISNMMISMKLLPCNYNPEETDEANRPLFPILMTAAHISEEVRSWKLWVKKPLEENATSVPLTVLPTNPEGEEITYASQVYYFNPYLDQGGLRQGTYVFQLEAELANREKTRSETVTMEVLKVDYQPIPQDVITNAMDNGEASSLYNYPWPRMMIEDLNFAAGDFIETDMDVSRCIYKNVGNDNDRSIGMDVLFSIGLNGINWDSWSFAMFYPAISNGDTAHPMLDFSPTWENGNYSSITYTPLSSSVPLHFRLDKDGFFWNNQRVDFGKWGQDESSAASVHTKLSSASKLYIGSTAGKHRSRAKYRFVRVVYNGRNSSTREGMDDFNGNPQNGGNL